MTLTVPMSDVATLKVKALSRAAMRAVVPDERAYEHDPIGFARDVLGHDPWATPETIMRAVARPNASVAVKACHGSSKCVAASEYLTMANGRRRQARDLVGQTFSLITITEGGIRPVAARAEWNAIEPVFAITTESGRRIVRNAHHPLWIADADFRAGNRSRVYPRGWTALGDIEPGQLVAVAERLPVFWRSIPRDEDEIKTLAYLVGDGGYSATGVVFSQQRGPQLEEFRACVERLGCRLVAAAGVDWRVVGAGERFGRRGSNPVIELLRRHGLMGKHSRDKRIPPHVFTLPKHQLAMFLSRLYATDGWANEAGIGFSSASEGLIRDLQELLLRFGVGGRICAQGGGVAAWKLMVNASADVLAFVDQIGIYGKEEAVRRAAEQASARQRDQRRSAWRHKKAPDGTRWERVRSIESAGIEPTVAIEVPTHHTYLTTFWEHNTFSASELVLWWVYAMDGIAVTTAPTGDQVRVQLWGEIRRAHAGARRPLSGQLNQTELRKSPEVYAIGRSTDQGVRFQGFHGRRVLVVIDEAPGVEADIQEAIEGIRASGDVRVLMLGNPTLASGSFYDAFVAGRSRWRTFTIDAFDTPNLAGVTVDDLAAIPPDDDGHPLLAVSPRPYLVTRRWVWERLHAWGEDHPLWQARVRGQFPTQSEDSLISLAWLEAARRREVEPPTDAEVVAGIDVAGPGEAETVVVVRQGPRIVAEHAWTKPDPRGEVVAFLRPWKDRLAFANVDSVGIGYYFMLALRDEGIEAVGVNVGEEARDKEKYANLKAELYWGLRQRFAAGDACGLIDDATIGQLAGVRYGLNARGQIVIESKEKARQRGVKSPDRAEALMLCFAKVGLTGDVFSWAG